MSKSTRKAKHLPVYSWQEGGRNRVIMVASSQAECARARGFRNAGMLFNINETNNAESIRVASAKPGSVFTRKLGAPSGSRIPDDAQRQPWRLP